ncbi:MAG: acetyl-CoA carboxylase biotin carboxyl carrier protein [Chlamydiia bacterium]
MDLNNIQSLIDLLRINGIKNFSVKEVDGREISLEFQSESTSTQVTNTVSQPMDRMQTAETPKAAAMLGEAICAEMVGTIYLSVNPQKPKFVDVGSKIRKGQTLCLIEAMKTYFEVKSTLDGTIEKVLIKDKETVDFGKPLFSVVQ